MCATYCEFYACGPRTSPQELMWTFAKTGLDTYTLETLYHARQQSRSLIVKRAVKPPNVACWTCVCSTQLHILLYSDHWVRWSSPSLYIHVIIYLQNYLFEWPCFAGWIMRFVPLPHNTRPCCRWSCRAGAETCSTDQRPIKIASPIIRFHRFKKKVSFILIGCEEYDNLGS